MMRAQSTGQAFAAAVLCIAMPVSKAEPAMTADVKALATVRFTADDDVKCLSDALETGNPESGASTLLLKATPGCVVPWHYHTAVEQLVLIRGTMRMEMPGHPASLLSMGGFAVMASKVPHRFVCQRKTECLVMVTFDRKYDIFWGKGDGADSH
jgi:quercetin dioxygenase-like cupin family protein